jgi:hypothetical protein
VLRLGNIGRRCTGTPIQIIPAQNYSFISEQKNGSARKCSNRHEKDEKLNKYAQTAYSDKGYWHFIYTTRYTMLMPSILP